MQKQLYQHLIRQFIYFVTLLAVLFTAEPDIKADEFAAPGKYSDAKILEVRKQLGRRFGMNGNLLGNIPADRILKTTDVRLLLMLSNIATDKHYHEIDREASVICIGRLGHRFGIPPLLAVLREPSETDELRVVAIFALSQIADKRAIDHLVDLLRDESLGDVLINRISRQLLNVTGRGGRGTRLEKGGNAASAADWKKWWKKNRKRVKLNRMAGCVGGTCDFCRKVLFGNPQRLSPKLSPDGRYLAYVAPDSNNVLQVWLRTVGRNDDRQLTAEKKRPVQWYFWSYDGEHLIYLQDANGNEIHHLYSIHLQSREVRDLTPFRGVSAMLVGREPKLPSELLVGMNRRDRRIFDVYRVNLKTGAVKLDTKNPGGVTRWTADARLQVRAGMSANADGTRDLLIRDAPGKPWKRVLRWQPEDEGWTIGLSADGKTLTLISNHNSNTSRLIALDLVTRKETVLAKDPTYDVWESRFHPGKRTVSAVGFVRQRLEWQVLDPTIAKGMKAAAEFREGAVSFLGGDLADRRWLLSYTTTDGVRHYYIFDRSTQVFTPLFVDRPALKKVTLAPMKPISLQARDGLTLHGYLTLPVGVPPKKLPAVLLVHGGPWNRDRMQYNAWVQWLANRGYVVLQINFRGSAGYGKKFLNAGNREWGGKMHTDLIDGVNWLVNQGVADPKRIGIMGASYGGYATLVGLTFTPDVFAAGVDLVGPSNLITMTKNNPTWSGPLKSLHVKRIGDPDKDTAFLKSRSPLFFVDRIKAPLLIAQGANDPSVKQVESDRIVAALRKARKPVEYIVYLDEGHDFVRPANRLHFCAKAEAFLARHLGGRFEEMKGAEGHSGVVR
eukprot:g8435.t1